MKNWYLLITNHAQERKARDELVNRQLVQDSYCPLTHSDKRKGGKAIVQPLFPRYVFFQMDTGRDNFYSVSKCPGVFQIVRNSLQSDGYKYPSVAPPDLIEFLRQQENDAGIHLTENDYKAGDRIRIKKGRLAGFEGIVKGTKQERVFALIDFMGQQDMQLGYGDIEAI